jgi:benzoylformate decarboxylase
MAADLVSMAKPVTKWATRVVDPSSLLRVLRRATKVAGTAPMGPVFVALPMDILDAPVEEEIVPTSFPVTRTAPEPEDVAQAAAMLAGARKPIIVVGDGVAASGAQEELARVAELVGAEVWGADSSEVNLSAQHPLFRGLLGHMFGEESRRVTSQADVVLICGTYVFPEVFPVLSGAFGPGAKVVHIDLDPHEIAKNFPADLAILSDPKTTLGKLADALDATLSGEQQAAAASRAEAIAAEERRELEGQLAADREQRDAVPLHVSRFAAELAARLPEDAVIFDEALTTSPEVVRYLPPTTPGHYFQTRGGSLGVGIPGAIGLKLAYPGKTVVGFTGDGGSLYTFQALWTAAHHRIGAKFVVCNNRSYRILKFNIQQYWKERDIPERDFPALFDLTDPDIRFDELAQSLGVEAVRVETPEQIGAAIDRMLADDQPFLIDLVITKDVPRDKTHVKCGQ